MIRFVSPSTLRRLGILGMNRRNIECIGSNNPRRFYPLVDNKLLTKQAALDNDIPTPELYGTVESQQQIRGIVGRLDQFLSFVIKPVQGSGGKGILVIAGREGQDYVLPALWSMRRRYGATFPISWPGSTVWAGAMITP